MNESRSIFSIDGITGILIATGLLLAILAGMTVWALDVQNKTATNYYQVKDEASIKMFGSNVADHIVDVE